MSSASSTPHGFQLGPYAVRWRCSRLRRHPWTSLALAGAMLAAGVWVGFLRGALWGVGAWTVQVLATWSWWLPVECEAGPRGLLLNQAWRRRRLPWTQMRLLRWEPGRCVLGYQGRNGTAEKHLVLTWPPHREDVSQVLRRYLQQGGGTLSSTQTMVPAAPGAEERPEEPTAPAEAFSPSPAVSRQNVSEEEQNPHP